MMKWGRKKPVSSTSSSTGLSRALPVSWFSKFNASSDSKPAKEKKKTKQDDEERSKNVPAKSCTKRRNDIQERRSNEENVAATRKKSDEKFEEIMSSVRKKVRDFQIETRGSFQIESMEKDKETLMIMTPRIRDKQRCERRDQKLLEQKRKSSRRDASTVLDHTVTKQAHHQWQKLKETKLREVKVKADQQRKSLYIRRELNRLGTKENNSKVRVFSPRATEKCRVKAIEDLKKAAKARVREDGDGGGGGTENDSFAVVKCSSDPQKDFRDSMIEMIMENGINHPEELKELLVCYLRLNTDEYHDMIIKVFLQVHNDLNFHYFGVE